MLKQLSEQFAVASNALVALETVINDPAFTGREKTLALKRFSVESTRLAVESIALSAVVVSDAGEEFAELYLASVFADITGTFEDALKQTADIRTEQKGKKDVAAEANAN